MRLKAFRGLRFTLPGTTCLFKDLPKEIIIRSPKKVGYLGFKV